MNRRKAIRGTRWALVLAATTLAVAAVPAAAQDAMPAFTDWTSSQGNVATGSLHGAAVTLSGTLVGGSGGGSSTVDGSSTAFSSSFFTPALATSDAIEFHGQHGSSYTLTFERATTDPTLHLASLASRLDFPAGTSIERISGEDNLVVSGPSVGGDLGAGGPSDANGTVRLRGVFTSLTFTTTPQFPGGSADGILLQVGAAPPPPAPPAPPPAPPAPPAAPPAVVTQVQAVPAPGRAMQQIGLPTTLIAQIRGQAERVAWDVTGDNRTDVTCGGNQNALLVRPTAAMTRPGPNGTRSLAVSVVPQGSNPFTTRLTLAPAPKPPKVIGRAQAVVDKKPPVYACGSPSGLRFRDGSEGFAPITRPCVVPTTIHAGEIEASGCFRPVNRLEDIPVDERGILLEAYRELARLGGLGEAAVRELELQTALDRSSAVNAMLDVAPPFITDQGALVNGMNLTPAREAALVVFPAIDAIASGDAQAAIGGLAGIKLAEQRRFLLKTAQKEGQVVLDGLRRDAAKGLQALGKLPLDGDIDVVWKDGQATIKAHVILPRWANIGKERARADVLMRANNAEGLVLDRAALGPLGVNIGALRVDDVRLTYTRDPATRVEIWDGQGRACITPPKGCFDMRPDRGGVRIVNGDLEYLGANLGFTPAIPIFQNVDLRSVGFRLGLGPPRFGGTIGLTVASLVDIDGGALFAFPTESEPYLFRRAEAGLPFPPSYEGRRHTSFTIAVAAQAFLRDIPIAGRIPLGDAYLLYEFPGYIGFGGGIGAKFEPWVRITGRVDGEVSVTSSRVRFSVTGTTEACLLDIICSPSTTASVSSRGAGGCVKIGGEVDLGFTSIDATINIGGGVTFDPFEIHLHPFDGCAWTTFIERNVRGAQARAAQAGGALTTMTVRPGEPNPAVQLKSASGAPKIRVTGPGGVSVDSSPGPGLAGTEKVRVLRSEVAKRTVVGLQGAAPGEYRIELLPGSPPVTRIGRGTDPGKAKIAARVEPDGTSGRYVLRYDVERRPRQTVTFLEQTAGGAARPIGTVSGGRGALRFSPAPGTDLRRVKARFELGGMVAEQPVVARFRPPSPRLPRVAGLRARRSGSTIAATWRAVPGARRYVVVASSANGLQRRTTVTARRATLRGLPRTSRVRVAVQPVAEGRAGPTAVATLARRGTAATAFRDLPRVVKRG